MQLFLIGKKPVVKIQKIVDYITYSAVASNQHVVLLGKFQGTQAARNIDNVIHWIVHCSNVKKLTSSSLFIRNLLFLQ